MLSMNSVVILHYILPSGARGLGWDNTVVGAIRAPPWARASGTERLGRWHRGTELVGWIGWTDIAIRQKERGVAE